MRNLDHVRVMTVKQWIVVLILLAIPFVNLVLIFVWAFGDNANENKRNFSRAILVCYGIAIGLFLAVFIGLNGKFNNNSSVVSNNISSPLNLLTSKFQKANLVFSNVIVKSNLGFSQVDGEITNKDDRDYSFVSYTISFYNENKQLMGTASGIMQHIGPNETRTFTAVGTSDYSKAANYKAQIDSVN